MVKTEISSQFFLRIISYCKLDLVTIGDYRLTPLVRNGKTYMGNECLLRISSAFDLRTELERESLCMFSILVLETNIGL